MARVLITGASRGLGRALVVVLCQRGHEVIASARNIADLADLKVAHKISLDVTDPASIATAAAAIGKVEVVINNAAIVVEGPVEAIPVEVVQAMFETNVFGPLRVSQAFLPGMRERHQGMIVNLSSLAGQFTPPLQGVYSATKAALERLSEALWFETQHFGVRVVVVASGGIRTGILTRQQQFSLDPYRPLAEQCEARLAKYNAQQRGASPEQVASTIAALIEQRHPPRRMLVGAFSEKLLARLGGRLMSRLTRLGLKWE
jgi:NAD(P)-dependent dehydrogenase (short-subunit alcohol dehydrogenase family)